jgi:hypothetical protein
MANAETFAMNAEAFLANAEAFAATLTCSPGQRGNPASCALSMILNLDWTDTLARRRGFFRALMAGRAGRRCLRMSLKGVSRSAKAPWRQANWPQAARLWVPLDPIVEAGEPAARTRQIQIRNRQQHLHTARGGEWQASVRPGPGPRGHRQPNEPPSRGLRRDPASRPAALICLANLSSFCQNEPKIVFFRYLSLPLFAGFYS